MLKHGLNTIFSLFPLYNYIIVITYKGSFIKKLKHPSTSVILKWRTVNEKQLCTPVISSNGKITFFWVSFPWNSKSVNENWSWNRTFWMTSKIFLTLLGFLNRKFYLTVNISGAVILIFSDFHSFVTFSRVSFFFVKFVYGFTHVCHKFVTYFCVKTRVFCLFL